MHPDVTEEGALQELGAEAGATDRDQRRPGTSAPAVDGPSQDPLPGPALAPNQDHGIGRGDLAPLLQHESQLGIVADQRDLGDLARDLLLQVVHAILEVPESLDPLQHGADLGRRERFRQVIERAATHRLDRVVDAPVSRDDHHGHPRCPSQECLHQVETRVLAEPEVQQRHVESRSLERLQCVGDPRGFLDRLALRLEGRSEGRADIRLVINDQDSHGSIWRRRSVFVSSIVVDRMPGV